jgi:hypothetical protein
MAEIGKDYCLTVKVLEPTEDQTQAVLYLKGGGWKADTGQMPHTINHQH